MNDQNMMYDAFSEMEDVQELRIVDAGYYDVVIDSARLHTKRDESEPSSTRVDFNVVDQANAKPISVYFTWPKPEDDPERKAGKIRRFKRFVSCFGVEDIGDLDSWSGLHAKVYVSIRPAEGDYEASNDIRFPKLAEG